MVVVKQPRYVQRERQSREKKLTMERGEASWKRKRRGVGERTMDMVLTGL